MARYEIDTEKGTVKEIEESGSALGGLIILVIIIAILGGGEGDSDVEY